LPIFDRATFVNAAGAGTLRLLPRLIDSAADIAAMFLH
jgi:hypothetical protein